VDEATVNAAQARHWNGDSAQHWINNRQRLVALHAGLTPRLHEAAAIAPGDRVLDVGCGCGRTTIDAARAAAPDGTALGLDLSAPMLSVARDLAADAGVDNARFEQADAQVYPLPPAGFDVVISSFGLMFFDDAASAFANLRAALRPGGRLAFLCWQDDPANELFSIPWQALAAHTDLPEADDADLFHDPARITGLLGDAGFAGAAVVPLTAPARFGDDVEDVLGYVRGMGRIRTLLADLDPEQARRVEAELARQYAARQGTDGVWIGTAAWLVTAHR
jgi:SAM-dependent methyltransferase